MNKWLSWLGCMLLLAAGFALVIVADSQGWFTESRLEKTVPACPHGAVSEECPMCNQSLPAASSVMEESDSPAPSVQLVRTAELPRSQRSPSVTCLTNTLSVQFLSPGISSAAGLEYARVESRPVTQTILCNAEVVYDGSRYAHLTSRAPGVVREVRKYPGQPVTAGEALVVVDAADLGTAKAEYLQAQSLVGLWEKNHTREKHLLESNVATERDILEAETRLTESRIGLSRAEQRLRGLGFSDTQLADISKEMDISSLLPLRAPFPGIVVECFAVVGESVDTQKTLISLADTSRMWAMLDLYDSDLPNIRNGQSVVFEAEGLPGEQRGGQVTWISSHVDRRTRTLKVRAEIANPDGLLRSGMFGKAVITVRKDEAVLVLPKESVQWEGCCNVVFVKKSDVLFESRKVTLGYETDRFFVVEHGVTEGEDIVTTGSFLLKTEILKGSIGAGCCEVEPGKS
ncbi:MAG: efflux RND transporter periplasmic adaptor subunit [bacterium]|nr:efflux RND transporter periplasmic adaptor subunit [bacterium]